MHAQPLPADHLDVEPAVVVGVDLGELHERADPVRGLHPVVAHLVALADREDAEDAVEDALDLEQLADQRAVALLEDVQRGDDAREHHRVQREQRHRGHQTNLGGESSSGRLLEPPGSPDFAGPGRLCP